MIGADLHAMLPRMLPRLWAFALRISGDSRDAEDLVQRACIRALERSYQLQPDTSPLNWMFSIVHSTWINEPRARGVRSRSSMEWDDSFRETVADPSSRTPETNVMSGQIVSVVERLPEADRIILFLIAVEGLTYNETAEVLDGLNGTVDQPPRAGAASDRRASSMPGKYSSRFRSLRRIGADLPYKPTFSEL